jgi:ectoine hydroxylase-related dioxygenase (phytanoyl-CoA dioxygenase family)
MDNEMQRSWDQDGYVVVRSVLDPRQVARLLEIAERVIAGARVREVVSGHAMHEDGRNLFHPNHPDYHLGRREDLRDLLAIGASERVLAVPRALFGPETEFRCFSYWFNPQRTSSDGHWHRDLQFTHPDVAEERKEFERTQTLGREWGGQFQIALIPSDDSEIVPGSHRRWDTPEEFAIRRDTNAWCSNAMPGARRIALQPGDGLIFDAKALHRGRYHIDRPRRTFMVTAVHPRAAREDVFTRQPWFVEPGYLDGLDAHATAFYRRFIARFQPSWEPAGSAS